MIVIEGLFIFVIGFTLYAGFIWSLGQSFRWVMRRWFPKTLDCWNKELDERVKAYEKWNKKR